jgi:lysophospholipase L1-like esterase
MKYPLNTLIKTTIAVSALKLAFSSTLLFACPKVSGFPDYNCDQSLDIVILGDSIPLGFGDTKNGNQGGYVLRTKNKLKQFSFQNFAKPGLRTFELLNDVNDALNGDDSDIDLRQALLGADVVFLDIGRNDRWLFGTPSATLRNLKRISTLIKSKVSARTNVAPLVVTAVIMLPNRGSQGPWVKELNALILKSNSKQNPADLRFDLVSKRLLGKDQIHPTSEGHTALFKTFSNYITKILPKKINALRPDTDADGIYDYFESKIFNTDISNPDTDGDGKDDLNEIFVLKTDPLTPEHVEEMPNS